MNVWYVVMSRPRREVLAETNLLNQGYRVHLPRLATQRRRDGKWVNSIEPLFPRYLFVAPESERQSLAPVRSTFGVSNLVRFGGQPATVPDDLVQSLQAQHDPATGACVRRCAFEPGQFVELRGGPFAGLAGVFEVEAGSDRVYVLLEFLGKLNKVKLQRDWLVPAA